MDPLSGDDLFAWLLGRWSFAREISGQGSMVGTAVFEGAGAGRAQYWESGELTLVRGEKLRAEQRYVYAQAEGGFAIYFHDALRERGELFERVVLAADGQGGWVGQAGHLCKADLYESEYRLGADGVFSVRHTVRGPKKDYVIRTVYRRD